MMGYGHSVSTIAAASYAIQAGLIDLPPQTQPAFLVAVAGFAMLPDADHPQATFAKSLPPLTTAAARGVAAVSGGHRHLTHSVIGVGIAAVLAALLNQVTYHGNPLTIGQAVIGTGQYQIGSALMMLLSGALAAKTLGLVRGWRTAWTFAVVAAFLTALAAPEVNWWLPLAVVFGCASHAVGDYLTTQGINPFSPFVAKPKVPSPLWKANGYMSFPVLGNAGSMREKVLTVILGVYFVNTTVRTHTGIDMAAGLMSEVQGHLSPLVG